MRLTEGVVRGQAVSTNHELQAGHDHHHLIIVLRAKGNFNFSKAGSACTPHHTARSKDEALFVLLSARPHWKERR